MAAAATDEGSDCEAIDAPRVYAQLAASAEPGAQPSTADDHGAIVTLPGHSGSAPPQQVGGEALLVLPKRGDGSLANDFELAEGVEIAESFWSPVLCATVARLVGSSEQLPSDLVRSLPQDIALAPNHVYTTAADTVVPVADPYRALQHGLDRLGVDDAGRISSGRGARVAVLDSAPQSDHRDLSEVRVVTLDGSAAGEGAVHGSLTTGVIAAVAGNGFGIAGAAPDAEVIAVPVCTPLGATARDTCALFDVLRGLDVALDERAQVFNLSLVGPPNPLLERATARLDDLGTVVVAAAGNEGSESPRYPAAYPSVVGVGAIDAEGEPDVRSNRGRSAEIWAPGADVLSTAPGGAFAFASGTSFASAHVSAALAVLIGSGAAPEEARAALFRASLAASRGRGGAAPKIAPLCDALAQLGHDCSATR